MSEWCPTGLRVVGMEFQIPDDHDHRLYDTDEAATFLRTTKDRLYDLCQAKKISYIKDGRRTLFFRYHLVDYLKRREVLAEHDEAPAEIRPELVVSG